MVDIGLTPNGTDRSDITFVLSFIIRTLAVCGNNAQQYYLQRLKMGC